MLNATAPAPPFEIPTVTTATPGFARLYTRNVLTKLAVDKKAIEAIEQIVSELVSNVVVHVGGMVRLEIEASDETGRITLRCTDSSREQTQMADTYGIATEHGYGLVLVDALALSVAEVPVPEGKTLIVVVDPATLAAVWA